MQEKGKCSLKTIHLDLRVSKRRRNSGHCGLLYHFLHDYDRNDGRVDIWLEIYGLSLSRGDVGDVFHDHYL